VSPDQGVTGQFDPKATKFNLGAASSYRLSGNFARLYPNGMKSALSLIAFDFEGNLDQV
jgi:hypothetical protein